MEDESIFIYDVKIRSVWAVKGSKPKILTTGSRAFGILGVADELEQAEQVAEEGCKYVKGKVWHRKDIGTKALIGKRVEHIKRILS